MCVCVSVCIYIYMCVCVYIYIYIHTYIYIYSMCPQPFFASAGSAHLSLNCFTKIVNIICSPQKSLTYVKRILIKSLKIMGEKTKH